MSIDSQANASAQVVLAKVREMKAQEDAIKGHGAELGELTKAQAA